MGKKKIEKGGSSQRGCSSQRGSSSQRGNFNRSGPQRVLLIRHGESESNATRMDIPDPLLTELGRVQAAGWKGMVVGFGAEVVLVSPLRRAIETALLAYEGVNVPVEICRHARELWWKEKTNTPSTTEVIEELLLRLPGGPDVCGVQDALAESADSPRSEHASIDALKATLSDRPEACVAVVCHWGVINALCGDSADNGGLVECVRSPKSGELTAMKQHRPPNAPRTR
uniref:Phosphoglycerate mutase n=1 Tax=Haptolina ericina TaxID=156174 RepID=A0A7S3EST8_9EUKA|mmetsp:Transcript_20439/g.45588  ORF Transcript_20439/g.45588 Transcript_20439/m.45588 type:complete len:228 (+) Transcript_20439:1344-2027(+)